MGVGAAIVLVVVAVGITIVIGIVRSAGSPTEDVSVSVAPVTEAALYVHVSGAVSHPGLYRLDPHSRVVDAVAAAGGFADEADSDAVNLARDVTDGEQLHVPREGEAPDDASPEHDVLVDLNTADIAELDTLPRIGPALAERIVAWREQNGRFRSVDDLLAVPGIGEKMLANLRDLVRV